MLHKAYNMLALFIRVRCISRQRGFQAIVYSLLSHLTKKNKKQWQSKKNLYSNPEKNHTQVILYTSFSVQAYLLDNGLTFLPIKSDKNE